MHHRCELLQMLASALKGVAVSGLPDALVKTAVTAIEAELNDRVSLDECSVDALKTIVDAAALLQVRQPDYQSLVNLLSRLV